MISRSFERLKARNRLGETSGFSLIEFIMVMVIFSTMFLSLTMLTNPIMNLMVKRNFDQSIAAEARLGLMRMVREINQVKDVDSVATATSTQFTFTDTANQSIAYAYGSGTLTRNNITFVKNISAFQLTYFDGNGAVLNTPTVSPTNIRRLQILMTVTSGGQSATVRSQVKPRNLTS